MIELSQQIEQSKQQVEHAEQALDKQGDKFHFYKELEELVEDM